MSKQIRQSLGNADRSPPFRNRSRASSTESDVQLVPQVGGRASRIASYTRPEDLLAPQVAFTPRPSVKRDPAGEGRAAHVATQYVRLEALLSMVPMSASTVWRKVRDGSFVRPVKLSARITAWNREAVKAWIAEREAS